MAQRNASAHGGTATRSRSRATGSAGTGKSDIAQLSADEIRNRLRKRGVTGISRLHKEDLVNTLVKAIRAEGRRSGGTGPAGRSGQAKPGAKRTSGANRATTKATGSRTTGTRAAGAKATGTRAAAAKAGTAKRAATKATGRGKTAAESKARIGATRSKAVASKTSAPKASVSKASAGAGGSKARVGAGGIREGATMSRSLRYAQRIASPSDRPDRPGRSLVTTNHDVIRKWARDRQAQPATISGTERDGRAGVLTFDFPGWRESGRLRPITWDEWFETFDLRQLNFIYQEERSNGGPSNFFRTESPHREDG